MILSTAAEIRSLGGDEQIRTVDPLRAKQVLSQLSYTPMMHEAFCSDQLLRFSLVQRDTS